MLTRTRKHAVMFAAAVPLMCAAAATSSAQVEVEIDPIAYGLSGFSVHVATMLGATRLNVGTFGIDIPRWLHGNEGWTSSMKGAGVKWDYIGSSSAGAFAGADGGYMRFSYSREAAEERERRHVFSMGVRGGYRWFPGLSGMYVAPWVGVSYHFDGADVFIGAEEFERSPLSIFPTVHVGWRF